MVKSKWQALQDGSISNRTGLMLMTLVLLLAFALGANGLNADVIWIDELYSVSNMGAFNPPYSPAQIVDSLVTHSPKHMPLFFLLGAGWAQLAGWSQFSMRLIALFSGVLMIVWAYRFGRDAVNRRTGLVAAFLMSTTTFVILYFHEIRMYSLLMLLAIVHSGLYWRLAHGFRTTRMTWILFILACSALLYTHSLAMITLIGLGVYHLLFISKSRRWLNIFLAWGIGVLLFLPYVPLTLAGFSSFADHTPDIPSLETIKVFAHLLVNSLDLLWLPLVLSFGYALWKKHNPSIWRLGIAALLMFLALLLVTGLFQISTTRMRYFLVPWFLYVILFAWGLTCLPCWRIIMTLFLLLWSIAGYQFSQSAELINYTIDNSFYRSSLPLPDFVYHLKDKVRSTDYLVGYTDERQVYSRPKHGSSVADYYLKVQLGIDGVFLPTRDKRYRLARDVGDILREHPHVLLAHDPSNVPLNYVKTLEIIQESYIPCVPLVNEPDLLIQRYVHPVMGCAHQPAPIEYDNGIKIIDRAASYVSEAAILQILNWWEVADEGLLDEYNVSLQIITPDWQNVRQIDRHLYDDLLPWNTIELSTAGLPPGDYRLMLILYNRDSGEKVSGLDLTSGEARNILPLLAFIIEPPG